ncbi:hypothetical protein [Psychrobacter sp. FDAARGOS_221]|uniref:hypothetical protein n=1 Tax=Psychrobacter sp. FDAARGOS_221 TaxID=1975705 RepID=UPI000BB59EA6|nr:hypothetical protein [Psychrobacter sp. FDAARGOS_221]PNK59581.1 hypothetical protein A6J60_000890 [Psychrobacter sp. FDAARGOS_221]
MKNISLLTLIGLSLTACVSGGYSVADSSNANMPASVQPVMEFPVESVMIQVLEDYEATFVTEYMGAPLELTLQSKKQGPQWFENHQVLKSELITDIKMYGTHVETTNMQSFYSLNPLTFYGDIQFDGTYSTVKQLAAIPKYAKVGDSQAYIQETTYKDSSKSEKMSSTTVEWRLTPASDLTAWLCMVSESQAKSAEYDHTGSECFEITASGEILNAKIEAYSGEEAYGEQATIELVTQ